MSLITSNSESTLIKKLINYLDTYNILYEITKQGFKNNKIENKKKVVSKFKDEDIEITENSDSDSNDKECDKNKKKLSEKLFNITVDYENLVNIINNIILDDNKSRALDYISIIEKNIHNNLITEILMNSPETDVFLEKRFENFVRD